MKRDMTSGNVMVSLLWFVVPLAIGNILQQLYNIIDTYIVGRYVGNDALAAVGSVSQLIFIFNAVIMGLKAGIAVTCSECVGRKDIKGFVVCSRAGLILVSTAALACTSVGFLLIKSFLKLISVPLEIRADASNYLSIIVLGLPLVFVFNYGIALAQSKGNSIITFIALLISTISNVVLDLIFIRGFKMGVKGAAFATVIAQFISAAIVIGTYMATLRTDRDESKTLKLQSNTFIDILKVSLPSMLQQGILSIGVVSISALINRCGYAMIAGVTIGGKIDGITSMPIVTIAEALSVFTAQNIGANKPERVLKGLKSAMGLCFALALILAVLIVFQGRYMISLFLAEPDDQIVNEGMGYMISILVMMFFMVVFRCFIGMFTGKKMMGPVILSFVFNIISRVAFAYITFPFIGKYAVLIANPLSVFVGAISIIIFYYFIEVRKNRIYDNRIRNNCYEQNIDCKCSLSGD